MKEIIFLEITNLEKEILQKYPDFLEKVNFSEEKLSLENVKKFKEYEIISTFIGSEAPLEVLKELENLKFIATRSTGFDHIDLDYCKNNNILVSNVPAYGVHAVAEYTFALLLCLIRKVYNSYQRIRESGSFSIEGLRGEELFGKTIGIIGTGRIGVEVIKIAKGFSMNVIAYDKYPKENLAQELNFQYIPLDNLLSQSDIITLHVPYNKETHHLLNKDNLSKTKEGVYIINTARGGIIETQALYEALKNGQIGGAALDVLEEEGDMIEEQRMLLEKENIPPEKLRILLANHVFIDLDNVIITSHNAFNTKEALQNIVITTMENIEGYLKVKPINLVN